MNFPTHRSWHRVLKSIFCLLGLISICIILYTSHLFVSNTTARRRIINADHASVLEACRDMITSFDRYVGESSPVTSDGSIWLSFWSVDGGFSYDNDSRLPDVLRVFKPTKANISTNSVLLVLRRPRRHYLYAVLEDDKSYGHPKIELINGLWYGHY